MVEAGGIEPPSEGRDPEGPTGLARLTDFRSPRRAGSGTEDPALGFAPGADRGSPGGYLRGMTPHPSGRRTPKGDALPF